MSEDVGTKEYRTVGPSASLAVVRGSASRALARIESRKAIQREAHALVLRASQGEVTRRARLENRGQFDWWADLRRERRRVYGGLLRFIDALIAKGWPEDKVQMIPGWISSYISDGYRGRAA